MKFEQTYLYASAGPREVRSASSLARGASPTATVATGIPCRWTGPGSPFSRRGGAIGAVLPRTILDRDRRTIRRVLTSYGVVQAGVSESVARQQDTESSDLDLIVRFGEGVPRDLIGLAAKLSEVTGLRVDVVDDESVFDRARSTGVGQRILRETVPL